MRVKETQPPASEGPASRAVALDKPLFQTHPLCTSVPLRRKMSIGRQNQPPATIRHPTRTMLQLGH